MRPSALRHALLLSALLSSVAFSSVAYAADAPTGNDEVTLKNGGHIRGTVVSSEPGVSVKVIEMGKTEPRVIPWAQVSDVERDKFAPRTQTTQPGSAGAGYAGAAPAAPVPVTAPRAELGEKGVVRLHIDSPTPVSVLSHSVQYGTVGGYGVVLAHDTPVCVSPCDQVIDGSRGEEFVASGDFPGAKRFSVTDMKGDVDLTVKPGKSGPHSAAIALDVVGSLTAVTGATLLIAGLASGSSPTIDGNGNQTGSSTSTLTPVGIGVLVGGVAMVVGGIVLGNRTRTEFDLQPKGPGPAATAAVKPRYWAGEF